jgi:hypothetical protein
VNFIANGGILPDAALKTAAHRFSKENDGHPPISRVLLIVVLIPF